ncbi:MAG: SDR family oxidoreductase [Bacteroidota bacterium]
MNNLLILGAGSDIGVACAEKFANEDFNLMLAGRNAKRFEPSQNDLKIRFNVEVTVHDFDAMDYESHTSFYNGLPNKPDVVICVFGYMTENEDAFKDWELAHRTLATNYNGAVSILNIVAMDFIERKAGSIIGISSVAGDRGRQSNFLYGSAKAGFTAYLQGLRNRLFKEGIPVTTVKPGFVNTKMTEGMKLPGPLTAQPAQLANAIYKGYKKKKNTIYVLWMWRWVMLIIKSIPEPIFKKLKL